MISLLLFIGIFAILLYMLSHINPKNGLKENLGFCMMGMFFLGISTVAAFDNFLQDYHGKERYLQSAEQNWVEFPWVVWLGMFLIALWWAKNVYIMVIDSVEEKKGEGE